MGWAANAKTDDKHGGSYPVKENGQDVQNTVDAKIHIVQEIVFPNS